MTDWKWVEVELVLAVHEAQLAEHGGATGVRDRGVLESALARAKNLSAYRQPDVAELAAAYGFGIAKNHAFVDGNKRTAFVAIELFLGLNGYVFEADDAQCVLVMLSVAAGSLGESDLASWIRKNISRAGPKR